MPLRTLVTVAGSRWYIEELFQTGRGQIGLDHYQVRGWTGWHRHVTLACSPWPSSPPNADLKIIALTVAEIRQLLKRSRPHPTTPTNTHSVLVDLATNIPSPSPTIPLPAQTGDVTLEYQFP